MHRIKGNIAWILPPRTATKFTKYGVWTHYEARELPFEEKQHSINPANLEDRFLFINVRNPYDRFLSWWRLICPAGLQGPDPDNYSIENYVGRIQNKTLDDFVWLDDHRKTGRDFYYRSIHLIGEKREDKIVRYPTPIHLGLDLCEIPLERVHRTIRFEHLYDDFRAVGFDAHAIPRKRKDFGAYYIDSKIGNNRIQVIETTNPNDSKWYPSLFPELIAAVNSIYRKDFEYFGYKMLSA